MDMSVGDLHVGGLMIFLLAIGIQFLPSGDVKSSICAIPISLSSLFLVRC